MENKILDRTEEKLCLAKELGADGYIDFIKDINKLTRITFKRTTEKEIAHDLFWGMPFRIKLQTFFSLGFPPFFTTSKRLSEWKENIPYGALLAIKEAKEQGMERFRVYFPQKLESSERFSDDPILVGFVGDIGYKIFHWDDGKVYE